MNWQAEKLRGGAGRSPLVASWRGADPDTLGGVSGARSRLLMRSSPTFGQTLSFEGEASLPNGNTPIREKWRSAGGPLRHAFSPRRGSNASRRKRRRLIPVRAAQYLMLRLSCSIVILSWRIRQDSGNRSRARPSSEAVSVAGLRRCCCPPCHIEFHETGCDSRGLCENATRLQYAGAR